MLRYWDSVFLIKKNLAPASLPGAATRVLTPPLEVNIRSVRCWPGMGRFGAWGLGRGEGRINSEDLIVRPHDDDPDITKHYSNSFYFVVKNTHFTSKTSDSSTHFTSKKIQRCQQGSQTADDVFWWDNPFGFQQFVQINQRMNHCILFMRATDVGTIAFIKQKDSFSQAVKTLQKHQYCNHLNPSGKAQRIV